jgi:4-amino-4-deoxy-L-arabinose transferase-like glycosyltransferase
VTYLPLTKVITPAHPKRPSLGHAAARLLVVGVIALGAVWYLWFLRKNTSPWASSTDPSGYIHSARMLMDGKLTYSVPLIEGVTGSDWDPYFQQPFGFRYIPATGRMAPTYSVGYPLHLIVAAWFVSLEWAPVLISVLAAAACAVLLIILCRQVGLTFGWAVASVVWLWASPLFIYISSFAMSDVVALAWSMAAISCALKARTSWKWALPAGIAVGAAVLVRVTDLLLLFPIACAFGLSWRRWAAFAAAGIPFGVFQAWYNFNVYGSVMTTGYGANSWAFSSSYVFSNSAAYAKWLPIMFGPGIAIGAVGLILFWRNNGAIGAVFATWIVTYGGFYQWYYFTADSSWSQRFILPALPALIIPALLTIRDWTSALADKRIRAGVLAVALASTLAWQCYECSALHAVIMKRGEIIYYQAANWAKEHIPPNGIVLARQGTGALFYYTSLPVIQYKYAGRKPLQQVYTAAARTGRPIYAVIYESERSEAFKEDLEGEWSFRVQYGAFTIWERILSVERASSG